MPGNIDRLGGLEMVDGKPAKPALKEGNSIALISPVTGAKKYFLRMDVGIAWGDPKSDEAMYSEHAAVLAGEQEDNTINILREFRGRADELIEKLIEWKDLYYVTSLHASNENPGLFRMIQDADGLTRYIVRGRNLSQTSRKGSLSEKERWPTFISRDRTASLRRLPDRLLDDFYAGHSTVEQIINQHKITVDYKFCPQIEKAMSQPLKETIDLPISVAMVSVAWVMWDENPLNIRGFQPLKKPKIPWKSYRG